MQSLKNVGRTITSLYSAAHLTSSKPGTQTQVNSKQNILCTISHLSINICYRANPVTWWLKELDNHMTGHSLNPIPVA